MTIKSAEKRGLTLGNFEQRSVSNKSNVVIVIRRGNNYA